MTEKDFHELIHELGKTWCLNCKTTVAWKPVDKADVEQELGEGDSVALCERCGDVRLFPREADPRP